MRAVAIYEYAPQSPSRLPLKPKSSAPIVGVGKQECKSTATAVLFSRIALREPPRRWEAKETRCE